MIVFYLSDTFRKQGSYKKKVEASQFWQRKNILTKTNTTMMVLNNKMLEYTQVLFNVGKETIDENLLALSKDGFIEVDGCFFLKAAYAKTPGIKLANFIDQTGMECFVNSFHVDDYIDKEYLQHAFLFISYIFQIWNKENNDSLLKGIISVTDFGANIKFHVARTGENWIDETNIDDYVEPIAVLTSNIG